VVGYKAARKLDTARDGAVGLRDSTGRSRRLRDSESYNVKDYGAVGDGDTVDTDSINEALTAASTAGGLVVFPPGTYIVDNNLVIRGDNVHLKGYRARLKVVTAWANSEVTGNSVVGGAWVAGIIDLRKGNGGASEDNRIENITIEDLEFEATENGEYDPGVDEGDPKGITANSYSSHVTVRNCRFLRFGHESIWPGVDATKHYYWRVLNNHFENDDRDSMTMGSTIQANFVKSVIQGNTCINSCSAIGIGNDTEVSGNVIITPGIEGIGIGDQVDWGKRSNVHGNVIHIDNSGALSTGTSPRGISLNGASEDCNVHGNTVFVTMTNTSPNGVPRGIYCGAVGGRHLIANNLVVVDQDSVARQAVGISAEPSGSSVVSVSIVGNTVMMSNESASGGFGILTITAGTAVMDATIANNVISGFTRANSSFAIDSNQNGGGTLRVHHLGNICSEGNRRINSITYNTSAYDNIPVYASSAGTFKHVGQGTAAAPVNLVPQAAPTSPVNGDIWIDTDDDTLKVRIDGATLTVTTS
jgi:hypothetical protein